MKAYASTLDVVKKEKPNSGPRSGKLLEFNSRSLPFQSVERLSRKLHVDNATLLRVIGIAERTAVRRQHEGFLKADEADRLLRVARIFEEATRVLGDPGRAAHYMTSEIPALDNETPLSLLDCDAGAKIVSDELERIQFGIFA